MRRTFCWVPRRWVGASMLLTASVPWLTGCQAEGDQRTDTLDPFRARSVRSAMPAGLAAALDSGSAAFRLDDFEAAAEYYAQAVALDSTSAPAWFGVYMAARALGRDDEAAEALQMTRDIVPGATILHSTEGDTLS